MQRLEDNHRDMHNLALLRAVRQSLQVVTLSDDAEARGLLDEARDRIERVEKRLDSRIRERYESLAKSEARYIVPGPGAEG